MRKTASVIYVGLFSSIYFASERHIQGGPKK